MKYLLRSILSLIHSYVIDKNIREFDRLISKWGTHKRYIKRENVCFLNHKFDIPDLPSFIWQFKEIYADKIYIFPVTKKSPIIYDCGANIGMSVLFFKEIAPNSKIKAFEADFEIAKVLKSNLEKNNIFDVEIINKAVWVNNYGVFFSTEGADGGAIAKDVSGIKVKSIRLKDYLLEEEEIDFLKIDIEGAEYEVLRDCKDILNRVNNIYIEFHSFGSDKQNLGEILLILEQNNFRYYLSSVSAIKTPFLNNTKDKSKDMQMNIFAYKL